MAITLRVRQHTDNHLSPDLESFTNVADCCKVTCKLATCTSDQDTCKTSTPRVQDGAFGFFWLNTIGIVPENIISYFQDICKNLLIEIFLNLSLRAISGFRLILYEVGQPYVISTRTFANLNEPLRFWQFPILICQLLDIITVVAGHFRAFRGTYPGFFCHLFSHQYRVNRISSLIIIRLLLVSTTFS